MAKRMFIFFSVIVSLMLASTSTIAAQTSALDVPAIAKSVLSADPSALLDGLQTPMRNQALPDGFSDAEYRDITGTSTPEAGTDTSKECLYDATGLPVEGAIGYSLTVDVQRLKATDACASVTYLVFKESDLGSTPLKDYRKGIEESIAGQATPTASNPNGAILTDTVISGAEAVLLTYVDNNNSFAVSQTLGLPIGTVFVITVVAIGDKTRVNAEQVESYANELTVAAINHLGTIADGAQ